MMDLQDRSTCPTLAEIGEFVHNPLFMEFCREIRDGYRCREKIEYSSCSWERGWNVKFKKGRKSLCTVYPREGFFTVLVVVGKKEAPFVEEILPECTAELQRLYHETPEGNGQRWLMAALEDKNPLYEDLLRLVQIRENCRLP